MFNKMKANVKRPHAIPAKVAGRPDRSHGVFAHIGAAVIHIVEQTSNIKFSFLSGGRGTPRYDHPRQASASPNPYKITGIALGRRSACLGSASSADRREALLSRPAFVSGWIGRS